MSKLFTEMLTEMARPSKYSTKEELHNAVSKFDELPSGQKSSVAVTILRNAEKLGYTVKKPEILKYQNLRNIMDKSQSKKKPEEEIMRSETEKNIKLSKEEMKVNNEDKKTDSTDVRTNYIVIRKNIFKNIENNLKNITGLNATISYLNTNNLGVKFGNSSITIDLDKNGVTLSTATPGTFNPITNNDEANRYIAMGKLCLALKENTNDVKILKEILQQNGTLDDMIVDYGESDSNKDIEIKNKIQELASKAKEK